MTCSDFAKYNHVVSKIAIIIVHDFSEAFGVRPKTPQELLELFQSILTFKRELW